MKWNTTAPKQTYNTYEGGKAYQHTLEDEWSNFIFSSYLGDSYYETEEQVQQRYIELTEKIIAKYGPEIAGKIAQFSRNELGLRSISQLTMAMINDKQFNGKRQLFAKYFHRPDDVAEILAAMDMLGQHWSHGFVRGAGDYLSTLKEYQLAKYKMLGKKYNLYDCINICHPKSKAITAFKKNQIDAPDTWEVKISTAKSKDDKNKEWVRLVREGKLGYLALLRNLRNIIEANISNADIQKYLVPQLTNEFAIKRSLVYPYQIYNAYMAIKSAGYVNVAIISGLEQAFICSCGNMPDLNHSAIILDVSGSMEDRVSKQSNMTIKQLGACFVAAIYLSQPDVTFIKFGNTALEKTFRKNITPFEIINQMCANDGCGFGTCLGSAYQILNRKYDNIFIISDMQTMDVNEWEGYGWYHSVSTSQTYREYINKYGTPEVYSFDLGHYHTTAHSPADNIHLITALNDKVFKFIEIQKTEKNLIRYIIENY